MINNSNILYIFTVFFMASANPSAQKIVGKAGLMYVYINKSAIS